MSGHFWLDERHRQTRIFFFLVRRIAENFFYAVKKKSPSPHFINYVKGMSVKREIEDINAMRDGVNALANIAEDLFDEDGDVICGAQPLPETPEGPEQDSSDAGQPTTPPRAAKKPRVVDPVDLEGFFNELNTDIQDRVTICRNYARYLVSTLPKVPKAPRKQKK